MGIKGWMGVGVALSLGVAGGCQNDVPGSDGGGAGGSETGGGSAQTGGRSSGGGSSTGGSGTTGGTANTGGSGTGGQVGGNAGEGGANLGGAGWGGEGGAGNAVAACEAAVDALTCGDSGRKCNFALTRAYCSEGNADAAAAFSVCYRLDGGCHTPADPGTPATRACFEGVIETFGTEATQLVRSAADAQCKPQNYQPLMMEVFALMAGDAVAAQMTDCIEAVSDCAEIDVCLDDNLGVPLPDACQ